MTLHPRFGDVIRPQVENPTAGDILELLDLPRTASQEDVEREAYKAVLEGRLAPHDLDVLAREGIIPVG